MGKHSAKRDTSRRRLYAVCAGAVCLVLGVGIALQTTMFRDGDRADASGRTAAGGTTAAACSHPTRVDVTVAPAIYDQVHRAAERATEDGTCADYRITSRAAGREAERIVAGATPDVWIPDSAMWVDEVGASSAAPRLTTHGTLATSPVVVAVPKSVEGAATSSDPTWLGLLQGKDPLRVSTPRDSSATTLALAAAHSSIHSDRQRMAYLQSVIRMSRTDATPAALLRAAGGSANGTSVSTDTAARPFPAGEQTLLAYNRTHAATPMTALRPGPGTPSLRYLWVTPKDRSGPPQKLLTALRDHLTSPRARAQLRAAGFRVAGEAPPAGSPLPAHVTPLATPTGKATTQIVDTWRGLSKDARMLTLIDVSGSMSFQVTPKRTRIQLLSGLALHALKSMPQSTELGLWAFSTNLRGHGKDWKPLTDGIHPIGPDDRKNAFRRDVVKAVHQLPGLVEKNGDTALYDAVWAAYRQATAGYDPDYVNSVVVLTDGKNEDPNGGLSLTRLTKKLQAARDPERPVKVVTIGVGKGIDQAALRTIAKAGHGQYYHPRTAKQISRVLVEAFLSRD